MDEYCLYLRKSRADMEAEARGEGETLARHERTLLGLAQRGSYNITAIYKELVSGETIASRPVMQRVLSEVEQGKWRGVLVMEVERLARGDTIDQGIIAQTFKFTNTQIITPTKVYNPNNEFDEEYFEFGLFMSRREYKTITRRIRAGIFAAVKEGKFVAGTAPYGYNRVKIKGDSGFTLEPNPDEADALKLIFELYTVGEKQLDGSFKQLGAGLIAKKLNGLGIKPRKAERWTASPIFDMLTNPTYCGKVRWNYRKTKKSMFNGIVQKNRPRTINDAYVEVKGLHLPLISEETFATAQQTMKKNTPAPLPSRHHLKNPLAGIVQCGICGRSMIRRPYTKEPDVLMCPLPGCGNVSTQLHLVEGHVIQALNLWLVEYKINWGVDKDASDSAIQLEAKRKAAKKIAGEIKALEKQLENMHDLLEQGIYNADTFLERSKKITERITQTQQNYNDVVAELIYIEKQEDTRKKIVPEVELVLASYHLTNDPKEKNMLLKKVLEKVIYSKSTKGRWGDPEDFTIDLKPRISN